MRSPADILKSISRNYLLLALLFLPLLGTAQERQLLEDKRQRLIQDIKKAEQLLQQTTKSRETALLRFTTLQTQIKKRRELIHTLEEEVGLADERLLQAQHVIQSLQTDIDKLFREYSHMTRLALRQKLSFGRILFLFSAHSINDAFRRWQYLRQYDQYRQRQARLIQETQASLTIQLGELESKKKEKQDLLDAARQQTEALQGELNQKDKLLKTLKSDESRLRKDLNQKRKAHEELNSAIEKIIREEMAKMRREERSTEEGSAAETVAASSANFEMGRGKHSWPVAQGTITGFFGKQEHPSISGVYITNNGIDIRTDLNAQVKCVFRGEVVGVQYIPGFSSYMTIIRHGDYYTVYSNLEQVNVERGQQVNSGDVVGVVRTDPKTNAAEVHFEVWKGKNRQDPMQWLNRR